MKVFWGILTALSLASCGIIKQNDSIYQALKANPPTSISSADMVKLRKGWVACTIFNEGEAKEYQTCWFPAGRPLAAAQLYFYSPAIRGGIVPGSRYITYIEY